MTRVVRDRYENGMSKLYDLIKEPKIEAREDIDKTTEKYKQNIFTVCTRSNTRLLLAKYLVHPFRWC